MKRSDLNKIILKTSVSTSLLTLLNIAPNTAHSIEVGATVNLPSSTSELNDSLKETINSGGNIDLNGKGYSVNSEFEIRPSSNLVIENGSFIITNNSPIKINTTRNIKFKNVIFKVSEKNFSNIIEIASGNNISFENCTFIVNNAEISNTTTDSTAIKTLATSDISSLEILNCNMFSSSSYVSSETQKKSSIFQLYGKIKNIEISDSTFSNFKSDNIIDSSSSQILVNGNSFKNCKNALSDLKNSSNIQTFIIGRDKPNNFSNIDTALNISSNKSKFYVENNMFSDCTNVMLDNRIVGSFSYSNTLNFTENTVISQNKKNSTFIKSNLNKIITKNGYNLDLIPSNNIRTNFANEESGKIEVIMPDLTTNATTNSLEINLDFSNSNVLDEIKKGKTSSISDIKLVVTNLSTGKTIEKKLVENNNTTKIDEKIKIEDISSGNEYKVEFLVKHKNFSSYIASSDTNSTEKLNKTVIEVKESDLNIDSTSISINHEINKEIKSIKINNDDIKVSYDNKKEKIILSNLKEDYLYNNLIVLAELNDGSFLEFKIPKFITSIENNTASVDTINDSSVNLKLQLPDDLNVKNASINLSGVKTKSIGNEIVISDLVPNKTYENLKIEVTFNNNEKKSYSIPKFTTKETSDDLKKYVLTVYKNALKRTPDEDGFNFWFQELKNQRLNGKYFLGNLLNEDEFVNTNSTPSKIIKALYECIVLREADNDGLDYWMREYIKDIEKTNDKKKSLHKIVERMTGEKEFKILCINLGIKY